MSKARGKMKLAEEVLQICAESSAFDNATHAALSAKTRVATKKSVIANLQNALGQTNDPEKKKALQARIDKKQAELKDQEILAQVAQNRLKQMGSV